MDIRIRYSIHRGSSRSVHDELSYTRPFIKSRACSSVGALGRQERLEHNGAARMFVRSFRMPWQFPRNVAAKLDRQAASEKLLESQHRDPTYE